MLDRCERILAYCISMILPDWFYTGLLDSSLVLTLDPV
jgi:hypothetical protein